MTEYNLLRVIGKVPMADYCGRQYWRWEEQIAQPALEALGYKVVSWYTVDGDACGPLVRGVIVMTEEGEERLLTYG
jgi:hypothetical protein